MKQNYALLSPELKKESHDMSRHRGYWNENSIDELNLQNPQKINPNSEYFEAGMFRKFFLNLLIKVFSKIFRGNFTTVKQLSALFQIWS